MFEIVILLHGIVADMAAHYTYFLCTLYFFVHCVHIYTAHTYSINTEYVFMFINTHMEK